MPFLTIDSKTDLYYEDHGKGQTILFLHGVMMSSTFFKQQIPYFRNNYRVIALDFRGHGQSTKIDHGHTVAQYAKDVKTFIEKLELKNVILVGWSMGAFVVWDYINQFGNNNLKAVVIVDQSPSDYIWPDWKFGAFDFEAIKEVMRTIQEDQHSFNRNFIDGMFKEKPVNEDADWILTEMNKLPASIESTIVFNQTTVDYRDTLSNVNVPTLICFGSAGFFPVAAGEYIQERIPGSKLVPFENSSHLLFLEETDKFNQELDDFFKDL